MRYFKKSTVICLGALLTVTLFGSVAFGLSAPEQPTGEPPQGLAISSKAPGTKLYGVVSIEYYNFINGATEADIRFVLRLRHGGKIESFFGEATQVSTVEPLDTQTEIISELGEDILEVFFDGDADLGIKLKAMTDFSAVDAATTLTGGGCLKFRPIRLGAFCKIGFHHRFQ